VPELEELSEDPDELDELELALAAGSAGEEAVLEERLSVL
jgi:hypothetical protein